MSTALLQSINQQLAAAGIELQVTKKRVKNVNFRLLPYTLRVSVPMFMSTVQAAQAVAKRVPWAISHHAQVLAQHQHKMAPSLSSARPVLLWGVPQSLVLSHDEKIAYYRQQLGDIMPSLFDKWQPVVGAQAHETRIKKMHTRWGSCNTHAKRIWLSVYLPAYPIECTEYVVVHELCHLHHANHSPAFWQTVAAAMPDYRYWHDMLAAHDTEGASFI